MEFAPPAAAPTHCPDPHQDQQSGSAEHLTNRSCLLGVVRALICYGRQLAATLQQRRPPTNLADIKLDFGTIDIGRILACITRGLLRAAALETRLTRGPAPQLAAPAKLTVPARRQPRAAASVQRSAGAADLQLARLPTPSDIAAQVRRRPVGAVIADICRDLGIVPANPLWREVSMFIIANGGNLAALYKDTSKRIFTWLTEPPSPSRRCNPRRICRARWRPAPVRPDPHIRPPRHHARGQQWLVPPCRFHHVRSAQDQRGPAELSNQHRPSPSAARIP